MKRRKIKDWLSELPEGYRERALHNLQTCPLYRADTAYSLHMAIECAFEWAETNEGTHFWCHVTNAVRRGDTNFPALPLPEQQEPKPALPLPEQQEPKPALPLPEQQEPKPALRGSPCYYRVWRVGGHPPTITHGTLESARKEALRLAGQHTSERFEILKCVGAASCSTPAVFWNDGINPDEA